MIKYCVSVIYLHFKPLIQRNSFVRWWDKTNVLTFKQIDLKQIVHTYILRFNTFISPSLFSKTFILSVFCITKGHQRFRKHPYLD